MGLLDWWRKSRVQAKISRARMQLEAGEYNEARLDLEGIDAPEAEAIRQEALAGLVQKNLAAGAAAWHSGRSGDANDCFGRARKFGATDDQIDAARKGPAPEMSGRHRPRG